MPRPYPSRYPSNAPKPPPPGSENWVRPWAQMKYYSYHPAIFPNMVGAISSDAAAGDLVNVYDKEGHPFGAGLLNPKARVPLRVIHHGITPFGEADLDARLIQAVRLRKETLKLDAHTDAYRVIHSDADGISGLIVDRYDDTLSILVTTLGVWRRIRRWLPLLHKELGTVHHVIQTDPDISLIESMRISDVPEVDDPAPPVVRIRENGVRYLVNFEDGHKTGFFCDQRDNRLKFGQMARGRVLDLCSYTGGFALAAKIIGKCDDVTGVDLDEKAIAQAKLNANLNQTKLNWTQGDAFGWSRQMIKNGELWDTVVLDPPKLIHHRDTQEEGIFKYRDLNSLAIQLVKRGGLFVSCSCSGLLSTEEFEELVIGVAHRYGRKLQILDRTGPGMDHPVMSNCPESRYLKVIWAIVV
ncbi:23S rRNA (cytosine1962-C5)-methyltransferase [Prosthecobacter fusiformis]|uniref:23S rRNA (Cytosine1962-C5)-methyltransferase n=1 Tax=Prosthecobacter fusiformis TaxID=48464 RepID=A0A4R7S6I3_9BACT|nr:class I SAM-dependent rRNA methyltransferase [Prosthecobacter fusiformis]TDU72807.1 23S rRNA (cytosine1962-C5)-methyltransferase [Prosthecobacter fusiformis]